MKIAQLIRIHIAQKSAMYTAQSLYWMDWTWKCLQSQISEYIANIWKSTSPFICTLLCRSIMLSLCVWLTKTMKLRFCSSISLNHQNTYLCHWRKEYEFFIWLFKYAIFSFRFETLCFVGIFWIQVKIKEFIDCLNYFFEYFKLMCCCQSSEFPFKI